MPPQVPPPVCPTPVTACSWSWCVRCPPDASHAGSGRGGSCFAPSRKAAEAAHGARKGQRAGEHSLYVHT